jgi:hypothetical protein
VCTVAADCTAPFKCVAISGTKGKLTCEKPCKTGAECGDDERCGSTNASSPGGISQVCQKLDCSGTPGEVAIDDNGDHECAKPCKTDAECTQSFRPRQCQAGATQLRPRKSISTCFPR